MISLCRYNIETSQCRVHLLSQGTLVFSIKYECSLIMSLGNKESCLLPAQPWHQNHAHNLIGDAEIGEASLFA